jgi:hypothetical protein
MQGAYFRSYARSANQHVQISQWLLIDVHNYLFYFLHAHDYVQIRQGLPINIPTFYIHSVAYKKKWAHNPRSIQLILLAACTLKRTKSKGLLINALYSFYYFQHVYCHVQKARGSRSTLHAASITFSTHIAAYKKQWAVDRCVM